MSKSILVLVPVISAVALIFAACMAGSVKKEEAGTKRMQEIAAAIREGASAFLASEYKVLAVFVAVLFFILGFALQNWLEAVCFLIGAAFSVLAGFFGMRVATLANVRTANAAGKSGMPKALSIAYHGGAVMGFCVVGLGILGASLIYLISGNADVLFGYSLGASSVALFARVGGGIYTKAADVGADLVGKVENNIPEDDPRNPAVIADNVGDNVGDVAGMGADLFESYVGAVVSAVTLGIASSGEAGAFYPLMIAACGIAASIIGTFFVRGKENGNPQRALNMGSYVAYLLVIIASLILSRTLFGEFRPAVAVIFGLLVGFVIGQMTEIYTSDKYKSVRKIAEESQTGAGTTIITGLAVGMKSVMVPILCICVGIFVSYITAGLYG
ncbi:MAG: sodium/proton-translocating pyrophosphatase, partial [Lachnospiraceae bacterium]|nr:sodium/proton-translocating pyrophosphatase [Lachnospiraceae bacterium]